MYFVKAIRVLVHKDEGHHHPERICAKILHRMRVVSEKNKKLIVIMCWPFVTIQNGILLSKCITIGLQNLKNVLLGVPKVVSWLRLMSAFE